MSTVPPDGGDVRDGAPRLAWALGELMRAVARLALAPDDQQEYLRRSGVGGSADELALQLDDAAQLLDEIEEAGWIEPALAEIVRRIDGMLDIMSGPANAALWEPAALSTAPEWADVREAAKSFLFR